MKLLGLALSFTIVFAAYSAIAQARGNRSGGGAHPGTRAGGAPGSRTNAPAAATPARPQSGSTNQFSAVPANAGFYFLADTNRAHLWIKVSSGTASNTVSKKMVPVSATTPVRSQ